MSPLLFRFWNKYLVLLAKMMYYWHVGVVKTR